MWESLKIWLHDQAMVGWATVLVILTFEIIKLARGKEKQKTLSYEGLNMRIAESVNLEESSIFPKITFLADGSPVDNPCFCVIDIINTGDKDITSDDMSNPLQILIRDGIDLLRVDVGDESGVLVNCERTLLRSSDNQVEKEPSEGPTNRSDITEFSTKFRGVEFSPFLLKKGENFEVHLLLEYHDDSEPNFIRDITVLARFEGVDVKYQDFAAPSFSELLVSTFRASLRNAVPFIS